MFLQEHPLAFCMFIDAGAVCIMLSVTYDGYLPGGGKEKEGARSEEGGQHRLLPDTVFPHSSCFLSVSGLLGYSGTVLAIVGIRNTMKTREKVSLRACASREFKTR